MRHGELLFTESRPSKRGVTFNRFNILIQVFCLKFPEPPVKQKLGLYVFLWKDCGILKVATCPPFPRYETYREGAKMPPITVAWLVAEKVFVLVDGWHRVEAAKQEGRTTIDAEIVECPSLEGARWLAAQANLTHGVPLKKKEVREVFRRYIGTKQHLTKPKGRGTGRKWESKPTDLIAEELKGAVDRRTVLRWLQEDHPEVYKRWYQWETNGYHKGKKDWKGPREPKKQSVEVMMMGRVNDVAVSLNELRLNAKLIDNKYARGNLVNGLENMIEEAKRVVEEIKGGGEWVYEVNDDF